jgi:hypothetical protein
MKISYDPEVDALSIIFRETTVTTKHLAEGIAADYPPRRTKADWLVWKFSMPKNVSAAAKLCATSNWKASAPEPASDLSPLTSLSRRSLGEGGSTP